MHEIIRADKTENHANGKWESLAGGVMDDGWVVEFMCDAAGLKLTASGGEYVLDPFAVSSIGERD